MPTNETFAHSSHTDAEVTKHAYLLKIKKLAKTSESIAACAHMIPDDEDDRNGLIEQLILNQKDIQQIIQYFIDEYGA